MDPKKKRPAFNTSSFFAVVTIVVLICFSLALLVFAAIGVNSRYLADDYCYSATVKQDGFFKGFWNIYSSWSGRFSSIFFTQFAGSLGPYFPALLPALILIGMICSIAWLIQELFLLTALRPGKLVSWAAASILVFFFYLLLPNRYQVLFWMNGSIAYSFPLVFLLLGLAWTVHFLRTDPKSFRSLSYLGISAIVFVGSGFSETNAAFQTIVFLLLLLSVLFFIHSPTRKKILSLLSVEFLTSVLGMVIIIIAPGNRVRQAFLPQPPGILTLATLSIKYAFNLIKDVFSSSPLPLIVLFLVLISYGISLFSSHQDKQTRPRPINFLFFIIIILVFGFICIATVCAPSIYAESAYPEARAQTPAIWTIVFVIGIFCATIARLIYKTRFMTSKAVVFLFCVFSIVLSLYPARTAFLLRLDFKESRLFAIKWDQRHAQIVDAILSGSKSIEVPAISSQHGIEELGISNQNWVNVCVEKYYGFESITVGNE